ncbi:MAG TPA: hypothetical protein VKR31_05790 [Rhizomicrobium sp.]|nr:hypothetical protein [Rhizomicrobium sp.]
MNKRLAALALLAASVSLPSMVAAATDTFPAVPMFKVGPRHNNPIPPHPATSQLPSWNGSYTDLTGKTITFTQIGGNPATTNTTSTINVLLIPIKFVITQNGTKYTFDPAKVQLANNHNRSVVQAMVKSPLFNSKIDYDPQYGTCGSKNNCVDLGQTQYEDAFQRGTWWGNDVGANPDYHVLFTTTKEKEQTITLSCSSGCVATEFGVQVGLYNFGTMDAKLQSFMKSIKDVNPGVLPLFITYDVYLTSGGCCIGGYHDSLSGPPGGQTYAYATYVDKAGAFSQDVSAFTHELGEWMDDPFIGYNNVNCNDNGWMEVGDPLENGPNYGAYPYKEAGFTWNLQSLVYMPYFGAPLTDSANQWYALQDDMSHVCPGQ